MVGFIGVGVYNNGVFGSESVFGIVFLVQVIVVVIFVLSLMNGQIVRFINMERCYFCVYDMVGIVMDDVQQGYKYNFVGNCIGMIFSSGVSNLKGWNLENGLDFSDFMSGLILDGINGMLCIVNENCVKFIGEIYFMRIK